MGLVVTNLTVRVPDEDWVTRMQALWMIFLAIDDLDNTEDAARLRYCLENGEGFWDLLRMSLSDLEPPSIVDSAGNCLRFAGLWTFRAANYLVLESQVADKDWFSCLLGERDLDEDSDCVQGLTMGDLVLLVMPADFGQYKIAWLIIPTDADSYNVLEASDLVSPPYWIESTVCRAVFPPD